MCQLFDHRLLYLEFEELSRLLKGKGIDANNPGRVLDPLEAKKEKLLAREEERAKKQTERHVLTKAMSDHAIPRLFVSRRNDKSPNGFNCSICQKDVSFLSRDARGIWRHFKCKGHYLKDRRYRYDHEDVIYTEKFDPIRVADLSTEQRAEIEETPPVVLGKMNKFIEDEVDALVGVPSNVPPTTLVGCMFELLRSGGSQVFLRRLWNQYRTTLPVESPYASVTWSKTETLVVLVQTLYPRVLRRVKSWLGDSPFSLALQASCSGVKCIVRCCPDDCLREVHLFDEDRGAVSCEAEMQCLSRVLLLVSTSRGPATIVDCPPVLFNAYVDWCCSVGRPVPIVSVTFGPDLLRRLINESSFVCVGSVDPFATVEYLVQRLKRVRHQAWLLNLPQLRLCLESGVVPFESLCEVLQELLDNWADVKLCLSNDVLLMKKAVNVVDLDSLLCSDRLGLPRLALLHVILLCYCSNFRKQQDPNVRDYACRNFTDFCFFYWSLLGKVKKVSQLPSVDNWFEYIDQPLTNWANVTASECLRAEPSILSALRGFDDAARRSFLRDCQLYLLEFLKQLGSSNYANSRIARSLSCLSEDMLVCGDAEYVVDLFQDLVTCLQEGGYLSGLDRESSVNEFKSLVVELRERSVDPARIPDIFTYLEASEVYQCRSHVKQVVRLLRVIVSPTASAMPSVDVSMSGIGLPVSAIRSGLSAVQSFVLHPKFVSNDLLTVECLEELKVNLPAGHQFLARTSFDVCDGVSRHAWKDIFESLFQCYNAYYSGQVEEWRSRMLAGPSSRGECSGAASVADTVSLAEASGSKRATSGSSVEKRKGSHKKGRQHGKSC